MYILFLPRVGLYVTVCIHHIPASTHEFTGIMNSNMMSFKRSEPKPVVKIILIHDRLHL
jgi:hypothetical protein